MIRPGQQTGKGWRAIAGVIGLLVLVAGLGAARLTSEHHAGNHTVPVLAPTALQTAGKRICPSLTPASLPRGLVARDRALVPFSATVLGVQQTWADSTSARSVEMLDGGYVDDITEPYDGLRPARPLSLRGTPITVLTTTFLKREVFLGYWHLEGVGTPCSVHAVIALGLDETEFDSVVRSLRAQ